MPTYRDTAEILAIVDGFESCRTDKDGFRHRDHLVVAIFYLQQLSITDATSKMKHNLLRFLDHHQVDRQKYNETITVFWLKVVANALGKLDLDASLVEKCNEVVEAFDKKGLVFEYYSRERLFSDEARKNFVRPDLRDWRSV
jgi:hypothetical protein